MKNILYTTALDINNNIIHIDNAEKPNHFFCPLCKERMVLKKSEKQKRRPHFSHKNNNKCSPETILHYLFKVQLYEKIKESILKNKELKISWNCKFCAETHSGNLLKKAKSVELEYTMPNTRPDIAILDENKNVVSVIEIIVTHYPEKEAIRYYKENNIILIEIVLDSDNDILNMDSKLKQLRINDLCIYPEYRKCGHYTLERSRKCFLKNKLYRIIYNKIKNNNELTIVWNCDFCSDTHSGNLLKKANDIKKNYKYKNINLDIAFFDKNNTPFLAINIINSDSEILKNEYDLIFLYIKSNIDYEDLEKDIYNKLIHPYKVNFCFSPRCKKCNSYMEKKYLKVIEGRCWRCNTPMKIAIVEILGNDNSPERFTKEDITLATSKNVFLKKQYSKTIKSTYLANSCRKCGTFIGSHFLFIEYVAPAYYGELVMNTYHSGYVCPKCDEY